jgi:hypothetical protein
MDYLKVSPVKKSPDYKVNAIKEYKKRQADTRPSPDFARIEVDFSEEFNYRPPREAKKDLSDVIFMVGITLAFATGLLLGSILTKLG